MMPWTERELFEQAAELPAGGEILPWLQERCPDDAPLVARVMDLLKSLPEAQEWWPEQPKATAGQEELQLGLYRLEKIIGQGGFATVWSAEQLSPVKRRVAVKILKAGMDTEAVLARFEVERQALAMMDHPGIARVLDAGMTAQGRPYFVMDLLEGAPLMDAAKLRQLSVRDRVSLMKEVAIALHHAHQRGVIHRDLKPSNIIVVEVDGKPTAKIIDFGIARLMDDATIPLTHAGHRWGTPAYMSPEQLAGTAVDVRTDIYSLGLVLYELLTGTLARPTATASRETSLSLPSHHLKAQAPETRHQTATERQTAPTKLIHLLRGDLDALVMNCLHHEPEHRYDSASALVQDLQRWLEGDPVLARHATMWEQLRRWVRRRPATSAAIFCLAAGLIATFWIQYRANVRLRAERAAADQLNAALADGFILDLIALGRFDLQERLHQDLEQFMTHRPEPTDANDPLGRLVRAQLLASQASIFNEQGKNDLALEKYLQAAQWCGDKAPVGHESRWWTLRGRVCRWTAYIYRERENLGEARSWLNQALALAHSSPEPDGAIFSDLAGIYSEDSKLLLREKRTELAVSAAQKALAAAEASVQHSPEKEAMRLQREFWLGLAHWNVAEALAAQGKPADALSHRQKYLELVSQASQRRPEAVYWRKEAAVAAVGLGRGLVAAKDPDAALKTFREATGHFDAITQHYPDRLVWHFDAGIAYAWLTSLAPDSEKLAASGKCCRHLAAALQTNQPPAAWWKEMDDACRRMVKSAAKLPVESVMVLNDNLRGSCKEFPALWQSVASLEKHLAKQFQGPEAESHQKAELAAKENFLKFKSGAP